MSYAGSLISGQGGPVTRRLAEGQYDVSFAGSLAACASVASTSGRPPGAPIGDPRVMSVQTTGVGSDGRTHFVVTALHIQNVYIDTSFSLIIAC